MTIAHLRCGSDLLPHLDAAGLAGPRLVWADPLCQGPLALGPRSAWRHRRAAFLAASTGWPEADLAERLRAEDEALASCAADELCLWFEGDLYDQAILVYLLAHLGAERSLSLVDRAGWPGVYRFRGLVDIPVAELPDAFASRVTVTSAHRDAARLAWDALAGPDPARVDAVRRDRRLDVLPNLSAALRRWLEEWPSVQDGLCRTERTMLAALAAAPEGATAGELSGAVSAQEERPWLGDTMATAMLPRLAASARPLVLHREKRWHLTDAGRAVVAGALDAVDAVGAPPPSGGASTARWRWDRAADALVLVG